MSAHEDEFPVATGKSKASLVKVPFGISAEGLANDLELLAKKLREGVIFPQKVRLSTRALIEEFEIEKISITYAEPRP